MYAYTHGVAQEPDIQTWRYGTGPKSDTPILTQIYELLLPVHSDKECPPSTKDCATEDTR